MTLSSSALKTIPLFKSLGDEDLALIASHLHRERHAKGALIFREGDAGETMYLVESGQVAVVGRDIKETIAFLGPGSFVGEISLLLAQPRTASLQVTIDAELWAFHKDDFEKLVLTRPTIAKEMMRELGRRLVTTTQRKQPLVRRRVTALFGGQQRVGLCQAIHQKLKQPVGVLPLPGVRFQGDATLDAGIMLLSNESLDEENLAKGLGYQVEVFKHVVIFMPDKPSSLAWKALDLADTIVSIGSPPAWLKPAANGARGLSDTQELWQISPSAVDIARAARRLTNRTVGLALSSGGARGLAHIGVLKALMEADVPIDLVSGTSGGAWFGALYCAGWQVDDFNKFVSNIGRRIFRLANADFNFPPTTALFKGRKARDRIITQTVRVKTFEELKTPLYIVAADILTGEEVVFDSGSLTDAIRASLSVPVLFDPWKYQGRYFVDGGVVNPLPANILRRQGADIVIGSSVIQSLSDSYSGRRDKMPHILQSVFNIVSAMESEVVTKQLPLIDILIQHRVAAKHTLDFEQSLAMVQAGEEAARQMLPQIKQAIDTPPAS